MSRTVVVETQVPEDVYLTLKARGLFRDALAEESRRLLALRYFQESVLTLGKAARLAGMSQWAFVEFLADNGVPVIEFSEEELEGELSAVDVLEAELRT